MDVDTAPLPNGDTPAPEENADTDHTSVAKKNKRLSIERIYQKKSQLEHILLRPDSYIGSVIKCTQPMWVMDEEKEQMVHRDITFSPGLYKIFDEILGRFLKVAYICLVNAADNKVRDPSMSCIKIDINP